MHVHQKRKQRIFIFFLLNLHQFEASLPPVFSSFQLANSPTCELAHSPTASARACPRIERILGWRVGSPCVRMCYNARMNRAFLLFGALAPVLLLASPPVPAALPPVAHADTETVTNVPFTASLDAAGRFRLSLSCLATPSNNVEAAFGVDRDADGVLSLEETDCVVGWDCGAWFVRKGADGARTEHAGIVPPDGVSGLAWEVQAAQGGAPTRLAASVDGAPAFAELGAREPRRRELAAGWLFRPGWNMVRLTGRGLEGHGEAFAVQVLPDAVVIRFR